jgi:hypothetical protein
MLMRGVVKMSVSSSYYLLRDIEVRRKVEKTY